MVSISEEDMGGLSGKVPQHMPLVLRVVLTNKKHIVLGREKILC